MRSGPERAKQTEQIRDSYPKLGNYGGYGKTTPENGRKRAETGQKLTGKNYHIGFGGSARQSGRPKFGRGNGRLGGKTGHW
jgi:hypothetical protein